jgi:hypothetical protein
MSSHALAFIALGLALISLGLNAISFCLRRKPYTTKKRRELEMTVEALKGTPDTAQIILPNPVKTAFDEGKVESMNDILI